MRATKLDNGAALNLRAGELVEVRSKAEILATLDGQGRKDALPFMPEMLEYCGRTFRVYKRADKTCDTIRGTGSRRMENAVHLTNVRCDGAAHGGCQAGCLMFWKEAWLKRVEPHPVARSVDEGKVVCSEADLFRSTRRDTAGTAPDEQVFVCQTTALFEATSALAWWDVRQYVRDLASGNIGISDFARGTLVSLFNSAVSALRRVVFGLGHTLISRPVANAVREEARESARSGDRSTSPRSSAVLRIRTFLENVLVEYPHISGRLQKTPSMRLDLRPGEYVQVKSKDEIVETLDVRNRNRGLSFDVEMVPYCGGTYRVLRRVEMIINEKTGRMMRLPNNCIVLDGVVCKGCLSKSRLFCPRSIYPYWHEIWLKRSEWR